MQINAILLWRDIIWLLSRISYSLELYIILSIGIIISQFANHFWNATVSHSKNRIDSCLIQLIEILIDDDGLDVG